MTAPGLRDVVLGRVRAALGSAADDADRRTTVAERLRRHEANLVPARANQPHAALLDLFVDMLRTQGTDVTRLACADEIPDHIADYLRDHNLPARLRMGSDPLLSRLPWDRTPTIERVAGRAEGDDTAALSRAIVGAAETGTLLLVSGPENPTTLNFLPDTHIAVIKARDVVGAYEEAWERVRAACDGGGLPRTVNLISGPSRTADIEQTIIMGAHGPRRLHVIVIDE